MALSSFDDEAHFPEAKELSTTLGSSARLWQELASRVAKAHAPIDGVWNFAGVRYGWSLRLKQEDRILLYLTPQAGQFLVGIVLGERAVAAVRQASLSDAVLALIDAAKPYAEGRGIRLPVTTTEDVDVVLKLVAAKMAQ